MPASDPARDRINQHLQDAIGGVREHLRRVEIWTAALQGFAQPIPDAEQAPPYRLPVPRKTDNERR
ncbi:MAG: hypothetical protein AB7K35_06660 [Pseudorhodoplanes sp.]